jgi:hypothetical protein
MIAAAVALSVAISSLKGIEEMEVSENIRDAARAQGREGP